MLESLHILYLSFLAACVDFLTSQIEHAACYGLRQSIKLSDTGDAVTWMDGYDAVNGQAFCREMNAHTLEQTVYVTPLASISPDVLFKVAQMFEGGGLWPISPDYLSFVGQEMAACDTPPVSILRPYQVKVLEVVGIMARVNEVDIPDESPDRDTVYLVNVAYLQ